MSGPKVSRPPLNFGHIQINKVYGHIYMTKGNERGAKKSEKNVKPNSWPG